MTPHLRRRPSLLSAAGVLVGLLTGFLGVGGGFLIAAQALAMRRNSGVDTLGCGPCPGYSSGTGPPHADRFVNGDRAPLTAEEQRGLRLFRGRANCTACYLGPTFSDERSATLASRGIRESNASGAFADPGRFAVSRNEIDRGAFKTPTLREMARTAPHMRVGSLATLEEVVEYYDRGGNHNPQLDSVLDPLRLVSEDKRAIVAFLKALSGRVVEGLCQNR